MAVFLKHVNLYYTGPNFPTLKTATYLIYFVIANKCKIVFITPKFFQRDDWASKLNSRLSFCYWVPVAKKNLKLYLPPGRKQNSVTYFFAHFFTFSFAAVPKLKILLEQLWWCLHQTLYMKNLCFFKFTFYVSLFLGLIDQ